MAVSAFISCRFPVEAVVRTIAEMLRPEINPYLSTEPKVGSLPDQLKERISAADCLIVILTESGGSEFVQNEVGIAYALNKPVFAIYEENVQVAGIQPFLSTYIKYPRQEIGHVAAQIAGLKEAARTEVEVRQFSGSRDELLTELKTNGVIGVFPDRASAFRVFRPIWERERVIRIVGSTIEGFKRGIGLPARALLVPKLTNDPESSIHILLTHGSFAAYRENQEDEKDGYILRQIELATKVLTEIKNGLQQPDRLQWKYFQGAPTCFMILAGNYMLLNPYLYMQPAYFNFSLIVRDTGSELDIYNRYKMNHFEEAWNHKVLTTDDPGVSVT